MHCTVLHARRHMSRQTNTISSRIFLPAWATRCSTAGCTMSGHQTTTTTRWPDCPASKAAYSATRIHRMRLNCTCVAAAKRLQAYISTRHQSPVIIHLWGVLCTPTTHRQRCKLVRAGELLAFHLAKPLPSACTKISMSHQQWPCSHHGRVYSSHNCCAPSLS